MHFDLRDLELFVAVAEAGSIAKAAEHCHTVASAVSKRLSDLEAGYGTALLVRSSKGVAPTPAGLALLVRARAVLHQAGQLDRELRGYSAGVRGQVRVFANISPSWNSCLRRSPRFCRPIRRFRYTWKST